MPQRDRRLAGVRAASQSTIEITFSYQRQKCRERLYWEPTPANLKRAAQFRQSLLYAIHTDTFDYPKTFPHSPRAARFASPIGAAQTFEAYLTHWLARSKKHLKASTYDGYRKIVQHRLIPQFGPARLTDLKRRDVRAWLDTLPPSTSNKRLLNLQSVLRKALADAVEDEILPLNPLVGWSYKRAEQPKAADDLDPFTADEQAQILQHAAEPAERNLFQFAFWTGLRTSELVSLTWQDVDFTRATVRIARAWTTAANAPEDTKTRAGRREVKLLAPALHALSRQQPLTRPAGREIFLNPRTGAPWRGNAPIWAAWGRALKRANIRYRRPYQTRHTYASMMLSAGEHPMWVAKQMGHASWVLTARLYARWLPTANPEAGQKAVEHFAPIDNTTANLPIP